MGDPSLPVQMRRNALGQPDARSYTSLDVNSYLRWQTNHHTIRQRDDLREPLLDS